MPESEFKFEIPTYRPGVSKEANFILQVSAMSGRLALENRTLVNHIDGRPENVAEHAHMLGKAAMITAFEFHPELSPGLVSMLANVHDDLEAYAGDTPTHHLTAELQATKDELEKAALKQLVKEYEHIPSYVNLVKMYEEQEVPEARFVRVLDKLMPITVHFIEGGVTLREGKELQTWLDEFYSPRTIQLLKQYPEFEKLIRVRHELKLLAREELIN